MSIVVNQSLQKVVKGAGAIFFGTLVGMFLAFVTRLILVNYTITLDEYGIYSIAFVILQLLLLLAALGMETGVTRQIAFYRGKGDMFKLSGVVISSLQMSIIASIFLAVITFLTADLIAEVLDEPKLSSPLKIFAVAIPFFISIRILASVFRGFGRAGPSVWYQHLLRSSLFPLFLIAVIVLDLSFIWVFWVFLASVVLTALAFAVYAITKSPWVVRKRGDVPMRAIRNELLLLSLPLLAAGMLSQITTWTDTLILGFLKTKSEVGLYNTATPLVHLLPTVLVAMRFLYVPEMSRLYAGHQMEEIARSYAVVTKWIFALTLPVFLVFVLFPQATLTIWGSDAAGAAHALQILSVGFFTHAILGPNGATLTVMGKTRFLMWSTLITMIANVILNIVLIPRLGIEGAAIATTTAFAVKNLLWAARLYSLSRIHPFTWNYLKPAIASSVLIFVIYVVVKSLFAVEPLWFLPVLSIVFLGVYVLSILLTRSVESEDVNMLLAIEKKLGINLVSIKGVLKRFV